MPPTPLLTAPAMAHQADKTTEVPLLESSCPSGTASTFQTLGNIVVSIVGTGVLGLPFAFKVAGWAAGSIGVIIAGLSTYYCMLLLVSLPSFFSSSVFRVSVFFTTQMQFCLFLIQSSAKMCWFSTSIYLVGDISTLGKAATRGWTVYFPVENVKEIRLFSPVSFRLLVYVKYFLEALS